MTIAESIAERLTYKAYASAAIVPGTAAVSSSDLGASGGQILRHIDHNLTLSRDVFQSREKLTDRTQAHGRRGIRRAPGTINGALSCQTYGDLMQASLQGTWAAGVTLTETGMTSVSVAAGAFVFAGGDPVSSGFRVGQIFRAVNLLDADNNTRNFLITGFSGASNRTMAVYPTPDTMTADTAFAMTTTGKTLVRPTSSHVSRKFALEVYNEDIDMAQLFVEGRFGSLSFNLPPTDGATIAVQFMGRGREVLTGGSAPFFTAPTAITTTDQLAGVDGLLRVNGATLAVVTGLSINCQMDPVGPAVVGSTGLLPEIGLPQMAIGGQLTALVLDNALLTLYDNETEFEILAYLIGDSTAAPEAMSIFLPSVKLTGITQGDQDGFKTIQASFTASVYAGSAVGYNATAIQIHDTQIS